MEPYRQDKHYCCFPITKDKITRNPQCLNIGNIPHLQQFRLITFSLNLLDFSLVQSNLTIAENQTHRLHYFGSQRPIVDSTKPL